ncbi:cadherin-like domain-containing protein [Cohnella sp. NL03-T5]|nr:cadherin-like domain-containing protein [Cohnella silvisoli]
MNMIHWKAGLSATEIPSDTYLQALTDYYKSNPALLGYLLYDEPSPKLFANLNTVTNKLKSYDPDHMVYVNLAGAGAVSDKNLDGNDVTPTSSIGQTFRTGDINNITSLQLWIDNGSWGAGEALTLTLWDSPAKATKIAESTLSTAPTSYWATFPFNNANVSPNTMYYFELTHNGGGDQKIGWVIRSVIGEDWEEGTAYLAGQPINSDWWFAINGEDKSLKEYESIVRRWADTHPDVLSFDAYPYRIDGGLDEYGIHSSYYPTLEAMRKVSVEKGIDVWSNIQSVGLANVMKVPTEADMRYQIYSNLAYGVKGLIYFTYWTPPNEWGEQFDNGIVDANGNRTDKYNYAKAANADVLKLGPTLLKLNSQAVYHTGPTLPVSTTALPGNFYWQLSNPAQSTVIGSFIDAVARKYVMVVNKDRTNSQNIAFMLPGKPQSVKEVSKTTGTEVVTNYNRFTGNLSADFAPGEGKLFVIDEVTANLAPVAHDSALSTKRNTPISSTLNASDADQDPLRYSIVANGKKGTATIVDAESGTFTYTPKNKGVSGEDTIKFKADDGIGISNIGTVTITIRKEK